jgi:hypothetical protein
MRVLSGTEESQIKNREILSTIYRESAGPVKFTISENGFKLTSVDGREIIANLCKENISFVKILDDVSFSWILEFCVLRLG